MMRKLVWRVTAFSALTFLSSMTCTSTARRLHLLLRVRHGPPFPIGAKRAIERNEQRAGCAASSPLPPSLSHIGTHDEWVHFFGRRQLCAAAAPSSAPPPVDPPSLFPFLQNLVQLLPSAKVQRPPAPAQPQNFEKCPGRPAEIFLSAGQRKRAKIHGCSWEICKVEAHEILSGRYPDVMGHSADQRAFPARLCANETEDTHAIEA